MEKDVSGDLQFSGKRIAIKGWSSQLQASLQLVQDATVAMNSIEVPRTLAQWQAADVCASTLDLGAATLRHAKPMLIRTWMIVEMRARAIKQLVL